MTGAGAEPRLFKLVETTEQLSSARTVEDVAAVVRSRAREISGDDGMTFILRGGARRQVRQTPASSARRRSSDKD